jgi:hypothetical protein
VNKLENLPHAQAGLWKGAEGKGVDGEGEARKNPLLVEAEGLRGEMEETVEEVKTVLDKLLLYLRVAHSIDYYNQVSILCVFTRVVCNTGNF